MFAKYYTLVQKKYKKKNNNNKIKKGNKEINCEVSNSDKLKAQSESKRRL